jgi:hypothetical protein
MQTTNTPMSTAQISELPLDDVDVLIAALEVQLRSVHNLAAAAPKITGAGCGTTEDTVRNTCKTF